LCAIQQRILAGEAELLTAPRTTSRTPVPAAAAVAAPRQLPAAIGHFVGRADELAVLSALSTEAGGAVVISAIDGMAGIGKTALAVHWAHEIADRYPDGQLYVDLRGFGPSGSPLQTTVAVRRILDALVVPAASIPADPHAQVDLYRSLLADKRMLIVLDNARDSDQVYPLLPGAAGCLVLVTSRSRLTELIALNGATPLTLDLLTMNESRSLLARRLGPGRTAREPQAVDELIDLCGRLPLALNIAAARAALHPSHQLSKFVDELRDADRRLDNLTAGEGAADARTVFSWSSAQLSGPAARMFRLLGLHPAASITLPAAMSLAGEPPRTARVALDELIRASLLTESTPGRYTLHELLRGYAAEQAEHESERRTVMRRMLDHYLHTAHQAAMRIDTSRDPLPLGAPQPGVAVPDIADHTAALTWFATEFPALIAATESAAENGFDAHAWQIPWTLASHLYRHGPWDLWAAIQRTAVAAATRQGDHFSQAHAHNGLGDALNALGRYDDSDECYRAALELYRQMADLPGQARCHLFLGESAAQRGDTQQALESARTSHDVALAAGDRLGQARARLLLCRCHQTAGQHTAAVDQCETAMVLIRELGDRHWEAFALAFLGYTYHRSGAHERAAETCRQAVMLCRQRDDPRLEAFALDTLGDSYRAAGALKSAREAWHQAARVLDDSLHPGVARIQEKIQYLGAT
jgi:tetratricopeptide (TPR) repeat protein